MRGGLGAAATVTGGSRSTASTHRAGHLMYRV
jgi:hypothetical protein